MRAIRRALGLSAVGFVIVACGDDPPPPATGAAIGEACAVDNDCLSKYCDLTKKLCSAIANIDASGKTFAPADVSIGVGEIMRWTFFGGGEHNVVSGDGCTPDGKFRSGAPQVTGTYERRFDVAGDFPYFCEKHCDEGMKGVVHVAGQ